MAKDDGKIELFDWLHSVNFSKTNLMPEGLEDKNGFDLFMVRKAVGQSIDTLELADNMQRKMPRMPDDIQYQYMLAAVPKKKRFASWPKKSKRMMK